MFTTIPRSVNLNCWGVSAARSRGPTSGSSLISVNVRSMTSRNSWGDLNALTDRPGSPRVIDAQSNLARPLETFVTIHIHPTAPLAERVLLPGDPGRALRLAQAWLESPAMFNHNRGLWGYTGQAGDGRPLTIQSTGMGGPSAAIVVAELAELGARRLIRVGTCGALDPSLSLGQLVVVGEALPEDGASAALGARGA